MKHKTLSILTALALLVSAPLFAQTPEPQDPDMEQDSVEATVDTEEGQANLTATDAESDTEVQATIDTEDDVDVDAEANFDDDEFDNETDDGSLPRTAGALPLLLLAGGAAGGSALSLRLLRRK